MNWRLAQSWVLRLVGIVELFAFGAVVMPRTWMETINRMLGLPEMPQGPVFDSVMREASFSYGLHGVAVLFIASDVVRYRPLVILSAVGYLIAGPTFIAIDLSNGLPTSWVVGNGGSCLLIGTLLFALLAGERTSRIPSSPVTAARP
jgi:hypothetical protein